MSVVTSLLKIEELLRCELCDGLLKDAHILIECGHRFCFDCSFQKVGIERQCPTCHLPAIVKNLRRDPLHNTLVACVEKLKLKLLNSSLTHTPSADLFARSQENSGSLYPEVEYGRREDAPKKPRLAQESSILDASSVPEDEFKRKEPTSSSAHRKSVLPTYLDSESLLQDMLSFDELPDDELEECSSGKDEGRPSRNTGMYEAGSFTLRTPEWPVPITQEEEEEASNPNMHDSSSTGLQKTLNVPPVEDTESRSNEKWRCQHCLFINSGSEQSCKFCREARGSLPNRRPILPSLTPRATMMGSFDNSLIPSSQMDEAGLPPDLDRGFPECKQINVMFTGIEESAIDECIAPIVDTHLKLNVHTQMIRGLEDVTHIVTLVDENRLCRRTEKYLHGIIAGKWIVDKSWLVDSIKARRWLPEETYEALGDSVNGQTHAPRRGRERVDQDKAPLFDGAKFHFFGDFKDKYNKNELLRLCLAAGGQVLFRRPAVDPKATELPDRGDLDSDRIDIAYPVLIIDVTKPLSKKNARCLEQYQVRGVPWMLNCLSRCHSLSLQ